MRARGPFSSGSSYLRGMLRLKLSLKGAKPPVTRTISMPYDAMMSDLAESIRMAFGWSGFYLHKFRTSFGDITNSDLDDNPPDCDEKDIELAGIKTLQDFKFSYVYDFGDNWVVNIRFLTDGKEIYKEVGENPPEDCGGVYAFNEIRQDPELRAEWGMDPVDDD